jgi:16S rRNA G966 N2-methylase RsmD
MESVEQFYKSNFTKSKVLNIVDGTANVGVDSLFLATIFNSPNVSITSVEINPETFRTLEKNVLRKDQIISITPFSGKMNVKNVDIIKYISETPDVSNIDILYLDPPWGGPNYKESRKIELSLGKMGLFQLISLAIIKKVKNIVCKVPKNLDIDELNRHIYQDIIKYPEFTKYEILPNSSELYSTKHTNVMNAVDVSYSLILFINLYRDK